MKTWHTDYSCPVEMFIPILVYMPSSYFQVGSPHGTNEQTYGQDPYCVGTVENHGKK